jgi:hypothetical protein
MKRRRIIINMDFCTFSNLIKKKRQVKGLLCSLPCDQFIHKVTWPTEQLVHEVAPSSEYRPEGHDVQLVDVLAEELYLPEEHE